MMLDFFDPTGASDCPKCGTKPEGCATANVGAPYYFIRCPSCYLTAASGPSVAYAVSFWNQLPQFDGAKETK